MMVAPAGTSAWRSLLADMARPRVWKNPAMTSTIVWSRTSSTPMTSAMASRVMSSWVGPRPPQTMIPSLRASAVRKASIDALVVVAHRLVEVRGHPGRGQVVAQPGRVGVGDLAEQQLGADRHDLDPHALGLPGRPGGRPVRYWTPVARVRAAATQIDATCTVWWWASGGMRQVPTGQILDERLQLGRVPGRDGDAPSAHPRAVDLHADLADGDEDDREPGQMPLRGQGEERTEHDRLVGQGVEEGPDRVVPWRRAM